MHFTKIAVTLNLTLIDAQKQQKAPNKHQLTSALKNPSAILRKKPSNIKKQTKFQLAQHRRSLSEGDLLHEIDNALVLSKGFLFARGMEFFMHFLCVACDFLCVEFSYLLKCLFFC